MIHVCGILDVAELAAALNPGALISIVAPEEQPPTPPQVAAAAHLRLSCHDIVEPAPMEILPDRRLVKRLIAFARDWRPDAPLLVHCQAGVSRSAAAALVVYAAHFPDTVERAAAHLRDSGPHVSPNPLIVALGDELLGLEGRLIAAAQGMGPPALVFDDRPAVIPRPDYGDRAPFG